MNTRSNQLTQEAKCKEVLDQSNSGQHFTLTLYLIPDFSFDHKGCKGLLLGLETVSEESLRDAKKRFNASVGYKQLIADLHQLGIAIQGCFVFGLDHDTPDVFDTTVQFAVDAGVDLPRFAVLTPFPGTPLHHRLAAEGRILTRNWEHYDGQHVVFQPKYMTVQELKSGHERAWKQVYRGSAMAKRLMRARNLSPLAVSANLGYRYYAHHLDRFYNCDWQADVLFPNPLPPAHPEQGELRKPATATQNRAVCG